MSRKEGPIFVSPEEQLGRSLDLPLWQRLTGADEFEACRVFLGVGSLGEGSEPWELVRNKALIEFNKKHCTQGEARWMFCQVRIL